MIAPEHNAPGQHGRYPISRQALAFLMAEFAINSGRGFLLVAFTLQLYRSSGDIWHNLIYVTCDALFAFIVPLLAGSWVDRNGPEKLIVPATMGVAIVVTALALSQPQLHADLLLLASMLIGMLNAAVRIGVFVLVPALVQASGLTNMNGRHQVAFQSGHLLGVLAAGSLMDIVGLGPCLLAVAVSTTLATWFYARACIGLVVVLPVRTYRGNLFSGFVRMLRPVVKSPIMVWIIVLGAADLIVVALFNLSLPLLVERYLASSPLAISVAGVLFASGSITLGWVVTRFNLEIYHLHRLLLLMPLVAIAIALQLIVFRTYFYFGLTYVLGFATALCTVYFTTTVQALVAPTLRGRFAAIRRMSSATLVGCCSYAFAAAYSKFGLSGATLAACVICIALALCSLAWVLWRYQAAHQLHADLTPEFAKICDAPTHLPNSLESSR
jgi:MFS family permease